MNMNFEWDSQKDCINQSKHKVSFAEAQFAFTDPHRIIAIDSKHSTAEETRYFCFGKIEDRVLTVRFTYRKGNIRIFGAGYWREGRDRYEQKKKI
ncbi:MAG: BrnT family toxin [Gemmatimonadetes bacterium]|nr:BrnT family toxin [Gemmatimonadota bacterium]MYB70783.1 BrnT family toxin [Gemmatimonadota bacterium]